MGDAESESSGPRIIDLAEQAVYVSVKDHLLVLEPKGGGAVRIELAEVGAVLAAHHGVTFTRGALAELATAGAVVVICDHRSMPISMCLPLGSFHAPARRLAAQVQSASKKSLGKRLWQSVVRAKVKAQAALLQRRGLKHKDLFTLAAECRSGDPTNVEAQASRIYWQRLFGADFRRVTNSGPLPVDENRYLNYGYAVLRALVCRSLCGAGLHPGIGIHHHHRNNPFPLGDDLIEPLRPLVDELALELRERRGSTGPMDRAAKEHLLSLISSRVLIQDQQRGLCDAMARVAAGLAKVYEEGGGELPLPRPWPQSASAPLDGPAPAQSADPAQIPDESLTEKPERED